MPLSVYSRRLPDLARRSGDGIIRLHYDINSTDINSRDINGAGEPVVLFLHGLAGHCGEWAESADALAPTHRTIRMDQRGHGRSTRNPPDLSREAFADDVAAVITATAGSPVTLVGQSMGAHTALIVAGRYPELVQRLIMVEGGVGGGGPEPLADVVRAIGGWPESFASYAETCSFFGGDNPLGRAWADGYAERNGRWWPRFDPALVHAVMAPVFATERWDIWDRLACPTDLVLAQHSAIDAGPMLDRRPETGCHVIPGARHDLHLDRPANWIHLLRMLCGADVQPRADRFG
ncbi:MAG TPA: alpha/beta hydrolase [Mycobacteriales bacterium]|nr:alpha/beta hydrolase [Mycobacteriales bacterium]